MTKLSVIIPIYNEAPTVEKLINRVIRSEIPGMTKEILLIESNSTDGTKEIVRKFEGKENIKIFYQDKPRGKGNAVKTGLQNASGDIILIQDADLEYRPEEYPDLVKPIMEGKTHFVLGSRHLEKGDWKIRKFVKNSWYSYLLNIGGALYTKLFNILFQVKLTDPATMYKVFKRECIKDINFKCNQFQLDWEIVAKLIKRGFMPIEVPVSYTSRSLEEGKKVRFFRDGTSVFFAILYFRFFD